MAESEYSTPRAAAAVILVRERAGNPPVEVYMIRRHGRASFMSSAYVFPGGTADPGEHDDLRVTAARELFEEAGVLFGRHPVAPDTRREWRRILHEHRPPPTELTAALELDELHYCAHWITPSHSRKRFSAVFYLGVIPPGEQPEIDNKEAVEGAWVTPEDAVARSRELHLHPPQLRTLMDLRRPAVEGLDGVRAWAAEQARHPHAILPRMAPQGAGFALLLPWDPEYASAGVGEALHMPADHPLAVGPSRFVLEDNTWKHIAAASSPAAE